MRIQTIETERLYIRSFEKGDARFAIEIWNSPDMGEYLPDESMDEITDEYLREIEALPKDEECYYLIAELKNSHQRIGTCSFMVSEDMQTYDIAYCVHKNYWKNGYATEMVRGMMRYAKQHGANKLTVRVNKENVASNKVMAKFGFKVVGESTYKKRGTDLEFSDYLYELEI